MQIVQMFTTTLGSAAVISAVSMIFFSSSRRSEFRKNNKPLYKVVLALFFGVLSIYATLSAVDLGAVLCNCRNLPALYAGLVGGPIAGIGAGIIGGLFRFFYGAGTSSVPCMIACICAGIIGSVMHLVIKKENRYKILTGVIGSVITECVHMILLLIFNGIEPVKVLWAPILTANALGMAFCLFMYKRCNPHKNELEEKKQPEVAEQTDADEPVEAEQ